MPLQFQQSNPTRRPGPGQVAPLYPSGSRALFSANSTSWGTGHAPQQRPSPALSLLVIAEYPPDPSAHSSHPHTAGEGLPPWLSLGRLYSRKWPSQLLPCPLTCTSGVSWASVPWGLQSGGQKRTGPAPSAQAQGGGGEAGRAGQEEVLGRGQPSAWGKAWAGWAKARERPPSSWWESGGFQPQRPHPSRAGRGLPWVWLSALGTVPCST